MALQSPFFGKRENEALNTRSTMPQNNSSSSFSPSPTASPAPARTVSEPSLSTPAPVSAAAPTVAQEPGSKLIVGPNIKLKGVEITDCDTLVVEGLVEATMDSRVIQIAEQGEFKGSAEIDIAEIRGVFDGNLTVRQKLVIYATGKVTGKIRYGKVVIEEGGQLSGDIECSASSSAKYPASSSQRSMALAA